MLAKLKVRTEMLLKFRPENEKENKLINGFDKSKHNSVLWDEVIVSSKDGSHSIVYKMSESMKIAVEDILNKKYHEHEL